MSKSIFNTDRFGKLEIKEVFFFFEHPHIFSTLSPTGNHYLAARLKDQEYALVPITEQKLYYAKMRKTLASTLILEAEESYLMIGGIGGMIANITERRFGKEELPYEGVCLCS